MPKSRQSLSRKRAINDIETGLRSLTRGLRRLALDLGRTHSNGPAPKRRNVPRTLRLQGRYMGLIRTLPATKKSRVMGVRASKGVEAAIRLAKELRG